jgi:hypothetical protein
MQRQTFALALLLLLVPFGLAGLPKPVKLCLIFE